MASIRSTMPNKRTRRRGNHNRRGSGFWTTVALIVTTVLLPLDPPFQNQHVSLMVAANDDYYAENFDDYVANQNNYNQNNNYNQQQQGGNDDQNNGNDDGAAQGDDNNNNANDAAGDDYNNANNNRNQGDDYNNEMQQFKHNDDDTFHWNANVGFDGVSVMPVSCVNYNNGHMIKFQLYDTSKSYQCHFAEISTFVVAIAHYMRAFFNYQALVNGQDFSLPEDASFLNCNKVQLENENGNDDYAAGRMFMYAKIGCMERATFTSTKLQLNLYVDAQCSQPYDDGRTSREHSTKGYLVGDQEISSAVSFRVPFYSCQTCSPGAVSGTFNKRNNNWYDDEYISMYGMKQGAYNKQGDDDGGYMEANDDINYDDARFQDDKWNNMNYANYNGGNRRALITAKPAPEVAEEYDNEFWREYDEMQENRKLYDNYYDIGDWNMCQRIYKYGIWCDADCRALDFFRTDQWSSSDIFLLSIMCTFLSGMMLLIVAKRLKAQQKARMYGDDQPLPGLPPFGMAIIFFVTMAVVITLAKLKFVNETLVFAVVTCILLFVYMLKLVLFENRRPVLLAAPRHDMFDNPLDDHLFD